MDTLQPLPVPLFLVVRFTREIYSNLVYGLECNQPCLGGVFTAE